MINVFTCASGICAAISGCALGPQIIKDSLVQNNFGLTFNFHPMISPSNINVTGLNATSELTVLGETLAKDVKNSVKKSESFLVLGGDHSCAIGTWSGAAAALDGSLGLIWIDAHMDAHTPETSPSNNIHGMPLAVLLGYGDPRLVNIGFPGKKINPEHVVLIGIRSFEKGEMELLKKLKVKIFFMPEIKERGLSAVLQEAVQIVSHTTAGFGVSIDTDAIDPKEAPGVGTPERNGLQMTELLKSLQPISQNPNFLGAEIVEFNPNLDEDDKTKALCLKMIERLFAVRK